ncbi:MAG: transcription factor S [Candidatus Thermoplasmatota archaeon]|nr:transcription factor S [Candidatus Thermoplasmatota archaeon]
MFCPKCKSLMYPDGEELVCKNCGYKQKKKGSNVVVTKQRKKEVTVIENKDDMNVLPKTKIKCPKCGNNEAYWILRQMRGSDEPESRFYTCTKCGHKWRED